MKPSACTAFSLPVRVCLIHFFVAGRPLPVLKSERRPLKLGMNSLETFTHIVTSYNEQVALEAVKQAFQLPGEA